MSLATVYSRAPCAINAPFIRVEVHLANGLPALTLVGLPEKAVKESKDRVRAAIFNSGFEFPQRHITVNLAPADLPKDGGRYDLAIALGILAASEQIPREILTQYEFQAELALSGELRPVNGVLPCALAAQEAGREIVTAPENYHEAALVNPNSAKSAHHLSELVCILTRKQKWQNPPIPINAIKEKTLDFQEVIGQFQAKRGLLIAAAGGHHVLMTGAPGTGKSMLAQRFAGILPRMTTQEAIESATVMSIAGQPFQAHQWQKRPFRAPHHSSSAAALVGGGSIPRPGEISLAHHGVLFLDELPEFDRRVLEMLREPLENGYISVSRAKLKSDFPARFQLVAAMNPCPCGYFGDSEIACRDTPDQVARYRQKISGPLLDRIDIHLHVSRLTPRQLREQNQGYQPSSAEFLTQSESARVRQLARQNCPNALLNHQQLEKYLYPSAEIFPFLDKAAEKMRLSMRSYYRILKVARTIADLADSKTVEKSHLSEALQYRSFDY